MKEPKSVFVGLLLLILLLAGYGVLLTVRCVSAERRLSRLAASQQALESDYRVLSNTLSHVQMTPELVNSLAAAMAQEGRRLPPPTNHDLRLIGSVFNSPPMSASSLAADTDDIRVVTWTYRIMPEDSLATVEEFIRGGQTNLVRNTHTKDGVVLFRSQSFYHNGAEVGVYTYEAANGTNTSIGSGLDAPYSLLFVLDSSNRPRSAIIGTIHTNDVTPRSITIVTLDSFGCSNGLFYPRDSSWLRKVNSMPNTFPLPR